MTVSRDAVIVRAMKRWTLDQLGEEVACALERVDYVPSASGRVRAVPDRRTIRYYTTIGLVDRPSEIRGRTAYYGRRHLLQLVAIKRLQAEGLSLRRVQERLGGLDDAALAELAQLPAASEAGAGPGAAEEDHALWHNVMGCAAGPAEA